jgi:hypothetical protein
MMIDHNDIKPDVGDFQGLNERQNLARCMKPTIKLHHQIAPETHQ